MSEQVSDTMEIILAKLHELTAATERNTTRFDLFDSRFEDYNKRLESMADAIRRIEQRNSLIDSAPAAFPNRNSEQNRMVAVSSSVGGYIFR